MYFLPSICNTMKQLRYKLHQVPGCCHCDIDQQRRLASQSSDFTRDISVMVDCRSGYQYWLTAGYVMLPADATSLSSLHHLRM